MLRLENVHSYYRKIHALKGISLNVKEKSICCLIGANGAGKSTTLMAISGIQDIRQGKIILRGDMINNCRRRRSFAGGWCRCLKDVASFRISR